jgi:hypothetical protein
MKNEKYLTKFGYKSNMKYKYFNQPSMFMITHQKPIIIIQQNH